MNLVKWFRKNNTKLMAIVVIVLMVGFIGGSALNYLLRGRGPVNKALAYYGDHKITVNDRDVAREELDILQKLGVPQILQNQDLAGILLCELLFPGDRSAGALVTAARGTIQRYGYRVSDKQLSDIYKRESISAEIYWILLRDEAQAAGIHFPSDEAGQVLGRILPQLTNGGSYARVMQGLVSQYKVPESVILATFGRLIAVLQYADFICADESVTVSQMRHDAAWQGEGLDAEFVQFKASDFADKKMVPPEPNMLAQLDKYKGSYARNCSETNPFGFGYKMPDRVQSEYVAIKLSDVQSIVKRPTQEDAEVYYKQNRQERFTHESPSDPNDPNSPKVARVQSFSEVEDAILKDLLRDKILTKAEQILTDARTAADANLADLASETGTNGSEPNVARLEKQAGSYEQIAQDLSHKHGVAIYSGRTGLLSASDIQEDKHLGRLRLAGYGFSPISIGQVLFSVGELGDRATVLLGVPAARIYRTIGPLRDPAAQTAPDLSNQIMAILRVVAVEKAAAPANLDVTYSTKTLTLRSAAKEDANGVHSVKDEVLKDLRILAAWDTARSRAQEFIALAGKDGKDGWDGAVTKFNDLYGKQLKADPNDPNIFRMDRRYGLQHTSDSQIEIFRAQLANLANGRFVLDRLMNDRRFTDQLYALVPPDANAAPKLPSVMESKPDQSFYALKKVTIERLNQQEFQDAKDKLLFQGEHVEVQSLAMIHFDPQNIVERMKFKYAKDASPSQPAAARPTPEDDL